jgi:hypothetical protein
MSDAGIAECHVLERMKRYTKFKVPLLNRSEVKLCQMVLEYRFVEKKELLDLLYSPNSRLSPELQRANSTGVTHAKRERQRSLLSPRGKTSR